MLVLTATGIYQSWRQVGSWSALTGTGYGQLLLVKVGLVAVLVGVAADLAPVDRPAGDGWGYGRGHLGGNPGDRRYADPAGRGPRGSRAHRPARAAAGGRGNRGEEADT